MPPLRFIPQTLSKPQRFQSTTKMHLERCVSREACEHVLAATLCDPADEGNANPTPYCLGWWNSGTPIPVPCPRTFRDCGIQMGLTPVSHNTVYKIATFDAPHKVCMPCRAARPGIFRPSALDKDQTKHEVPDGSDKIGDGFGGFRTV